MKTRIFVVQKINSGIRNAAAMSGDVANFSNGRNGLAAARRCLSETMNSNFRSYGSIGAGSAWLEWRDGTGCAAVRILVDGELSPGMTAKQVRDLMQTISDDVNEMESHYKIGLVAGRNGQPMPDVVDLYGEIQRGYSDGEYDLSEMNAR